MQVPQQLRTLQSQINTKAGRHAVLRPSQEEDILTPGSPHPKAQPTGSSMSVDEIMPAVLAPSAAVAGSLDAATSAFRSTGAIQSKATSANSERPKRLAGASCQPEWFRKGMHPEPEPEPHQGSEKRACHGSEHAHRDRRQGLHQAPDRSLEQGPEADVKALLKANDRLSCELEGATASISNLKADIEAAQ